MTVSVLWLFLTMPWVGLQYVIVVLPKHTHLLFNVRNHLNFIGEGERLPGPGNYFPRSIFCMVRYWIFFSQDHAFFLTKQKRLVYKR